MPLRIILRGCLPGGERHNNIPDDCVRLHRVASLYGMTPEIDSKGRGVFEYDKGLSERMSNNHRS